MPTVDLAAVRPARRPGRALLIVGLIVMLVGPLIGLIAIRNVASGVEDRFHGSAHIAGGDTYEVELAAQTTYALTATPAAAFACAVESPDGQIVAVTKPSGRLAGVMDQFEVTTTVAGGYLVRCDPVTPGTSITVLITVGDSLFDFTLTLVLLTSATVGLFVLGGILLLVYLVRRVRAKRRQTAGAAFVPAAAAQPAWPGPGQAGPSGPSPAHAQAGPYDFGQAGPYGGPGQAPEPAGPSTVEAGPDDPDQAGLNGLSPAGPSDPAPSDQPNPWSAQAGGPGQGGRSHLDPPG
jgi:hypothetical protein